MEVTQTILTKASELFCRYGIKSVSIDDICHELGMSKKTFYQHYSTKDELVDAVLELNIAKTDQSMEEYLGGKEFGELIGRFAEYNHSAKDDVRRIPALVYYLQKYYPAQFASFQQKTFETQKKHLINLFTRGIEEGYVRPDLEVELTAVFFAKVHNDSIRDMDVLSERGINVLHMGRIALEILVRGILTPKGLEKL